MLICTYMIHMRKILLLLILFTFMNFNIDVYADATSTNSNSVSTSSSSVINFVITNIYKDIKLKVPSYKQQYANSCEAATLRMALAFKNIKKNEIQILTKFDYNPTYKDWTNNIWDDPQKQYVGYVDVSGKPNGGYGVYGLPVAKAIESLGLRSEYATGTDITASFLARSVDNRNPVIVWGYSSYTEPPYTWKTKEGIEVKAFRGEHVRLIVGYKGTVEKPIGFYINDSLKGKYAEYWTTQKLMENIQKVPGVTDQAVVVK
jgi:hypothetical protein